MGKQTMNCKANLQRQKCMLIATIKGWHDSEGKQTTHMSPSLLDNQQQVGNARRVMVQLFGMLSTVWCDMVQCARVCVSLVQYVLYNVLCNWFVGQSASEKCWLAMVCCRKWGSGEPAIATLFIVILTSSITIIIIILITLIIILVILTTLTIIMILILTIIISSSITLSI